MKVALQCKIAHVPQASQGNRQNDAENLGRNAASVVNYYPPERDDADEVVRSIETEGGRAIVAAADVADTVAWSEKIRSRVPRRRAYVSQQAPCRHQ